VLDADARRARRTSRAARILHPSRQASRMARACGSNRSPSVVRSVPARLRSSSRQFSAFSSARTARDRRLRDPQPVRRRLKLRVSQRSRKVSICSMFMALFLIGLTD
jgi:hypothetical protein